MNPQTKEVFTSRDVVFVENESWYKPILVVIDDKDIVRVDMPTHSNVKQVS